MRLLALTGWPAIGLAWGGGALSAFSFQPFGLWPLLILGFGILIRLAAAAHGPWRVFWIVWWFAFGQFTLGLWWIANAMLVDFASFWWMVPVAVLGLPALLAVFPAVLSYLAVRVAGVAPLTLAAAWFLAELARGHLFTGFPWNVTGQVWASIPLMAQGASYVGVYGLSLLTLLSAVMIASLRPKQVIGGTAIGIAMLAVGLLRLPSEAVPVTETIARLVQPNVPQKLKWQPDLRAQHIRNLIVLSQRLVEDGEPRPNLVVWPETAIPMALDQGAPVIDIVADLAKDRVLITGAVRVDRSDPVRPKLFNSLMVFEGQALTQTYDKAHLVPFGEYVPFADYLSFLRVAANVNFSPGPGVTTLRPETGPSFSPLICYEIVFPGAVVSPTDNRPEVLINVTNDAWYGDSPGPYQHFAITRLRAIEEGLPVIRVANTGVSGMIDPFGRVVGKLDLGSEGILDVALPERLPKTVYAGWSGLALWLFTLLGVAIILVQRRVHDSFKSDLT